ncbi:hypothetical protein BN8_06480 [Fibrisoma limi BUZ 3]|uniref:Uncharacterized protein n=1 Tax=Fibrisoma limi BUZ 3 TaxID=1185876 RepID=I2GT49_9BACT|nr:hypothetical protein BN8_06480 [Fibrisoma limi BUZ 3]
MVVVIKPIRNINLRTSDLKLFFNHEHTLLTG